MKCRVLCTMICVLVFASSTSDAATYTILTNQGSGQDGLAYAGIPSAAFSTAFSVVSVGKTTGGANDSVGLFQFDLSTIPAILATDVSTATLRVFSTTSKVVNASNLDPDASHAIEIGVSPTTSSWNRGTLSWNTQPTHGAQATTFDVDGLGSYFTVDVTGLVQAWLNGSQINFGLWLEATTVMGSGPNSDASPYYAIAFNSGFQTAANGGGANTNAPELVINTVPEPATVLLALAAAPALVWAGIRRARGRRQAS